MPTQTTLSVGLFVCSPAGIGLDSWTGRPWTKTERCCCPTQCCQMNKEVSARLPDRRLPGPRWPCQDIAASCGRSTKMNEITSSAENAFFKMNILNTQAVHSVKGNGALFQRMQTNWNACEVPAPVFLSSSITVAASFNYSCLKLLHFSKDETN